MAKPRIFISSTYYDLRNIRSDLERYILDRNYEPVLNERGHIPYQTKEKLEEYCYREIANCNILISIIGGRYGSLSQHVGNSITQKELKTAIDQGKQIYIFIEKSVLNEYRIYEKNKSLVDKIEFSSVEDPRVFQFIDEVFALPLNNQYTTFESSQDIIIYLQEQWASLFHSLLQDATKHKELEVLEDLKSTATTLNQLVTFLTEEKKSDNKNIAQILFINHPIFSEIKVKAKLDLRVFFYNLKELDLLLTSLGFATVENGDWDEPNMKEWANGDLLLKIALDVFDDKGKLKLYTPEEWDEEWVKTRTLRRRTPPSFISSYTTPNIPSPPPDLDDELPF
ncbi:DUF4062 domain-containing protein [Acinetobacter vivianii]|uniref:DUF4062 domain-containing protein n=1 Tax=Acinetobacter vivianii TaxID=1776742 RepID=UPI003D040929